MLLNVLLIIKKTLMTDSDDKKDEKKIDISTPANKPEPETLHTTDPQEHMEGPISSLMHSTGHSFETDKTKKEADEEKDADK